MAPDRSETLLKRLLEISKHADAAEAKLEERRRTYERTHEASVLDAVRDASREALEAEVEFEAIWNQAIKEWFGPSRPRPPESE